MTTDTFHWILLPKQSGINTKAARAQLNLLGGEIEPQADRIVVNQAEFFRIFLKDLSNAKKQVIIYSPFLTQDRVLVLYPHIKEATERNVQIFIITKTMNERPKKTREQIKKIKSMLLESGAVILYKRRMHEKVIFIDDDIIWQGSLNPLSYTDTQEVMERRNNRNVAESYRKILRLDDLLSLYFKEEGTCPICGDIIVASEGRDEPFYWRCINDNCYTRSIGKPYPRNGLLACNNSNCNAPVKFGYWGEQPCWRCTDNNRHHQRIYKFHLKLPKMLNLIPKHEREKVFSILRVVNLDGYLNKKEHGQLSLYDITETNED